ncbi:lipopolysaccharide heptosyltransferase family protein [Paraflavitalea soli]|uniref:Lipopolysaccharide heptosyltransferase family protein n=1 Tax=Paraflavitalea soli TaxID=2315862 RepID=A0A3B7MUP7_9BACT|nr:glycosyltransferase family 9 protein [Paraflavitalea soli]AXY77113.1 lipopolysaccharide heptosyltransferase family protein [Paraflavitalea soli]
MRVGSQKKSWNAAIKLWIVMADYRVSNFVLDLLQKSLFTKKKTPVRILIFRTGSLGDNLCAIPSIVAIRRKFPEAQLDILANAGSTNLVTFNKLLHPAYYESIIDYFGYSKKALFSLLLEKKYDMVIYLPQTGISLVRLLRDMFFFRFIARTGFGWEKSTINYFKRTQEKHIVFDNEITRLNKLLARHGIAVADHEFLLNVQSQDQQLVDEYFDQQGISDKKKNIAVVVGAKRPQNRWPIHYFKEVISHFNKTYNIILIGGPEDKELTMAFRGMQHVFDCCGHFTPVQSAMALKKCHITISNDTGPMHLSYAVGTPTIALFSSRDFPGKWFPPAQDNIRTFRTPDVSCSICLSETCKNNICMQAILPAQVIEQTEQVLQLNAATQQVRLS